MSIICSSDVSAQDYSVMILGDTHCDQAEFHIPETLKNLLPVQIDELKRNAAIWSNDGDGLKMLESAAKCVTPDTKFLIQVGDLAQGDAYDVERMEAMFRYACSLVKDKFPKLPCLVVKGNHDIRGGGAEEAYNSTMLPFLARELGEKRTLKSADFTYVCDGDLYIFLDCISFDQSFLEKTLENTDGKFRHVFVVTHYPVMPCSYEHDSFDWFLGGNREKTRRLLAKANAIVITGHVHTFGVLKYVTPDGTITQVIVNSVVAGPKAEKFHTEFDSFKEYFEFMMSDQKTSRAFRRVIAPYAIGMMTNKIIHGAGFAKLHVSPSKITVDFYCGSNTKPSEIFVLWEKGKTDRPSQEISILPWAWRVNDKICLQVLNPVNSDVQVKLGVDGGVKTAEQVLTLKPSSTTFAYLPIVKYDCDKADATISYGDKKQVIPLNEIGRISCMSLGENVSIGEKASFTAHKTDSKLELLIKVKDGTDSGADNTKDPWLQDSLELFFDYGQKDDFVISDGYSSDCIRMFVMPRLPESRQRVVWTLENKKFAEQDFHSVCRKTPDGYEILVTMPLPSQERMGLAVKVNDAEKDSSHVKSASWGSQGEEYHSLRSTFGILYIKPAK